MWQHCGIDEAQIIQKNTLSNVYLNRQHLDNMHLYISDRYTLLVSGTHLYIQATLVFTSRPSVPVIPKKVGEGRGVKKHTYK
jgi:hypothetical protein